MKKIITCLLMVCLLSIGNLAYATTPEGNSQANRAAQRQQKEALKQKRLAAKELKAQLQPLLTEIKENRIQILRLKADVLEARIKAVAHIKELKKNKDQLTAAQIDELKNALETLKQSKIGFGDTKGDVRAKSQEYKAARPSKDTAKMEEALKGIITVQKQRIELLQKSLDNLKGILEI